MEGNIELREGDFRNTLASGTPTVDLLPLDSKFSETTVVKLS